MDQQKLELQTYSRADSLAVSQILYILSYGRIYTNLDQHPLIKWIFPLSGMIYSLFHLAVGPISSLEAMSIKRKNKEKQTYLAFLYSVGCPFCILIYWQFVSIDVGIGGKWQILIFTNLAGMVCIGSGVGIGVSLARYNM